MVNFEVVLKRIEKAVEYLAVLKTIKRNYTLQDFQKDPMVYGSAERFLHLCIEAMLDIGTHIIADQNLGKVEFYSDVPCILWENRYIDKETRDLFIKMAGFRNILVHDYLEVDLDIVYRVIQEHLSDLEKIIKIFGKNL